MSLLKKNMNGKLCLLKKKTTKKCVHQMNYLKNVLTKEKCTGKWLFCKRKNLQKKCVNQRKNLQKLVITEKKIQKMCLPKKKSTENCVYQMKKNLCK